MTGRQSHSTQASASTCSCGRPILTGWDDGLLVRAYAQPLDPAHEPAVVAAGLFTYTRTCTGWLWYRGPSHRRHPLDPNRTIHAQHRCNGGHR
jgi:hypothetical protein